MEGGKLIDQGTYGCVFDPPLLCKKKQFTKGKIGKITKQDNEERERHAFEILSNIKEAKRYFILAETVCTPKVLDNQVEKDIDKCRFLKREGPGALKQIAMNFGGKDLGSVNWLSENTISFFTLMRNLLEAGSLMVLHGFVHFDLSRGNVVVDKNNIPRIIDFGESFSKKEISLQSILERWKVLDLNYSIEPPEITFLTAIDEQHYNYSFEEALLNVMPQKGILKTIEKILGIPIRNQIINLGNFFKNSQAFKQKDIVKIWNLYYPGFDSWSIGVILIEILSKLIFSYEFIESSEWKLKKRVVVDILRKMLNSNPKERIDCVEALSMLDPVNQIYLDYGLDWVENRMKQRRIKKL